MKTCPPISRHHRPKSPYRLLSPPTETDEKRVHQSVVITDPNHPIGCCPHRPKPMKPVHQSVAITDPNHPIGPHRPKPMKTRPPQSPSPKPIGCCLHQPKPVHQSVAITDRNHPYRLLSPPTETDENPSTNQSPSPTQITLSVAVPTDRNR